MIGFKTKPSLLILLVLSSLFFFSILLPSVTASGAVIPRSLSDSRVDQDLPLNVRNALEVRAPKCSSSNQCGRNSYCSWGRCRHKKYDGASCTSYHSCVSGSCNQVSGTCQSSNLSLDTRCSSSMSCSSGNCQNSICTRKQVVGAYCYKAANCLSSNCDLSKNRCAPSGNGVPGNPELVPTLPWDTQNLADLENLRPQSSAILFFSDQGALDLSVSQLFATIHTDFSMPAVVLSHSSWVGEPVCQTNVGQSGQNTTLAIPFGNQASYEFAKKTWSEISSSSFLIVTHTDGCSPSTPDKVTERTYWETVPNGVTFDDAHRTIDVVCHEVAHEDAVDAIDVSFGGASPSNNNSNGTLPSGNNGSGSGSNSGTGNNPGPSSGSCSSFTGSTEDGLPAAPCGQDFDQTLDREIGFYDLTDIDDFSNHLQDVAPGLDDYNVADYEYYEDESDSENSYSGGVSKRGILVARRSRFLGFTKVFTKIAAKVVSVVKENTPSLANAKALIGIAGRNIPGIGPLLANLGDSIYAAERTLHLSVKPPSKGMKATQKWGDQYLLYNTTGSKTSKNSKTSTSGSLSIFCVDCFTEGSALFSGRVGYLKGSTKLNVGYINVNGSLTASANIGMEAEFSLTYKNQKTIASYPLFGFSIQNYVSVGPVINLDGEFDFDIKAEGTLLVGGKYEIEAFEARVDLLTDSNKFTQSGFTPKFTKRVEATGEITVAAGLGLPVVVAIGVKVPAIKIDATAGIRTVPGVGVTGKFTYDTTQPMNSTNCNGGIRLGMNVKNDVIGNFGTKDFPLYTTTIPVAGTCVQIFTAKPTSSSTTTTTDTSTKKRRELQEIATITASPLVRRNNVLLPRSTAVNTVKGSDSNTNSITNTNTKTAATGTISTATSTPTPTSTAITTTSVPDPDQSYANPNLDQPLSGDAQADILSAAHTSENNGVADTLSQDKLTFVQLIDGTGKYMLSVDDQTGQFVLQNPSSSAISTFFGANTTNGIVSRTGDEYGFVYYPDEFAKYKASRIRAVDVAQVPQKSDFVAMAPISAGGQSSGKDYVFVSSDGVFLATVLCSYQDGKTVSRLFVIDPQNSDTALANLRSANTDNTVTGGIIAKCDTVAFQAPLATAY